MELKKDKIKTQFRKLDLIYSEPTREYMQDLLVELMCALLNDCVYGFKAVSILEKELCRNDDLCFLNVISVTDSLSRKLFCESWMVDNKSVQSPTSMKS